RKPIGTFEPAALTLLHEHPWPGNVRELDHAVERAVLMAQGGAIQSADLGLRRGAPTEDRLDEMSLEDIEALFIRKAMSRYGNVSHAAKALGLSRSALYRRLERHRPSSNPLMPSHDRRVLVLALAGGAPAVVLVALFLRPQPWPLTVRLAVGLAIVVVWLGAALLAQRHVARPLQTISNLLAALREGDF